MLNNLIAVKNVSLFLDFPLTLRTSLCLHQTQLTIVCVNYNQSIIYVVLLNMTFNIHYYNNSYNKVNK